MIIPDEIELPGLSKTEDRVVRYLMMGLTNKEISAMMFVSPGTIHAHIQHIYEKLGIHNEIQLYNWYCEMVLCINIRNLIADKI